MKARMHGKDDKMVEQTDVITNMINNHKYDNDDNKDDNDKNKEIKEAKANQAQIKYDYALNIFRFRFSQ